MNSKSKDVLQEIAEKKGYKFFSYASDVIRFSKTFKDVRERIEYLYWSTSVYSHSNKINYQPFQLLYEEDGVLKDQFLDLINIEIKVLSDYLVKMEKVKSDLKEKSRKTSESKNIESKSKRFIPGPGYRIVKYDGIEYKLGKRAAFATSMLHDTAESEIKYVRIGVIIEAYNYRNDTSYRNFGDFFKTKDEKKFKMNAIKYSDTNIRDIFLEI